MTPTQPPDASVYVLKHCIRYGCSSCGKHPTPADIRRFKSHAKVDAKGVLEKLTHKCPECLKLEN